MLIFDTSPYMTNYLQQNIGLRNMSPSNNLWKLAHIGPSFFWLWKELTNDVSAVQSYYSYYS